MSKNTLAYKKKIVRQFFELYMEEAMKRLEDTELVVGEETVGGDKPQLSNRQQH